MVFPDVIDSPSAAQEAEAARLRELASGGWLRKVMWAACPVCAHCGEIVETLNDAAVATRYDGERKLYHVFPCFASAIELMMIRAMTPRRDFHFPTLQRGSAA